MPAENNKMMSFAPEESASDVKKNQLIKWKLLIVDDEHAVHDTTKRVLFDLEFEGKTIQFLHAYSGKDARQILRENSDIAVILLDVVMEEENSGLKLVKFIRNDLENKLVRIILRTGQPGKTPEKEVIIEYDINDYKAKTELTANKLYSTIISSLRSYRDLKIIHTSKKGLEHIIRSTSGLFLSKSLKEFAYGALIQLLSFLKLDENSLYINFTGLSVEVDTEAENKYLIRAATGKFEKFVDQFADPILSEDVINYLNQAVKEKKSFFKNNCYVAYFKSTTGNIHLLFIKSNNEISHSDQNLIRYFSENVGNAFENINTNLKKVHNQTEIIYLLSDVLEHFSTSMKNHSKRVARYSELLGKLAGLDKKAIEILKTSSALHDIGNAKMPRDILEKPGKLTETEFDMVRQHPVVGHQILINHPMEVFKSSAIIALQHHERYDGLGYPSQLKGDQIDIKARITSIADTFDVLLHDRTYQKAWEKSKVKEYIQSESGKRFAPELVEIFIENIEKFFELNDSLSNN